MRWLKAFSVVIGVIFFLGGSSSAVAASASLSHSYKTNESITPGSLVSNDPSHSGYVMPSNTANEQDLVGVSVPTNQSLLTINANSGNIQVALGGSVSVLVSTLNGSISNGDLVGVSPINGVGIKAESNSRVIGVAQANFNTDSAGAKKTSIVDINGHSQTIAVGYIPLIIAIGTAPNTNTGNGNVLQKLAGEIAGHSVSLWPAIVSSIITLVTILALIALIYGTIRGSLLSIGRNPLAKPAIFESLAQVLGMTILIVVIAVFSIYLILR